MKREPGWGRLVGAIAAFVLVGGPMALYAWHVLSETLAGRFEPVPFVIAVVLAGAFLLLARGLGTYLWRLQEESEPKTGDPVRPLR